MSDQLSGPTPDPIQQLETFGTGGIAVNPLDPASVRRLGDQRRRRQNTMYGAIAAVVVAAAVIPTALIATKDEGSVAPPTGPPTVTQTPEPTPTVITFPGNGVEVKTAADVEKLTGTTSEFKTFIAATLQKAVEDGSKCSGAYHGVTVTKYDSDGFALGGVNSCGGYEALWSIQNGAWKEALGTQDEWVCGDLTRFSVPDGFAGECYGPKQVLGPDSDAGIQLGMTMDEVRAAGGTVSAASTDGTDYCRTVNPKGFPDVTDADGSTHVVGYLSVNPDRGVVALFAQKDQVTPRGVRTGDLLDTFKKAYPEATKTGFGWYKVPISDTTFYRFDFNQDGALQNISMVLDGSQGCYE
ncbi:MAG: hypothetical protein ACJ72O_09770 [Marmoricola sp.]